MKIIVILLGYLRWHYSKAVYSLGDVWRNFLAFVYDFFSINLLFKNFFDPWKRMADEYPKKFDLNKILFIFIANVITRAIGIIMRTFLILLGLTCYLLLVLLYPVVIIIWLFLPLIIIVLIYNSFIFIIK